LYLRRHYSVVARDTSLLKQEMAWQTTVSTSGSSSVTSCLVEQLFGHTIYMLLISLDYRMGGTQAFQFCRWIHAMSFLVMSWYQTWVNYFNSSVFLSIFTRVFVVFDSALSLVA